MHRKDIFVFSGGLCSTPSPFSLGFDIGLPTANILYGCFAEAIILSLEGRYESFSRGKMKISLEQIQWMEQAAAKHGFSMAPFFWGDRLMTEETVKNVLNRTKVVK